MDCLFRIQESTRRRNCHEPEKPYADEQEHDERHEHDDVPYVHVP